MKAEYNIDQATGRMLAVYLWIEDCEPDILDCERQWPAWKNCEADKTSSSDQRGYTSRITRLRLYGPVSMEAIFQDMHDRHYAFDGTCWGEREKRFLRDSVPVCWSLEQSVESLT